jgi:hypothetical protein
MLANLYPVYVQLILKVAVDGVDRFAGLDTTRNIRLSSDHNQAKTASARLANAPGTSGKITTSARSIGDKGLPSQTRASLSTPSRSRNIAFVGSTNSARPFPLGLVCFQSRMGDQEMPYDGLEGLGVRSNSFWIDCRNDANGVTNLCGIATVAPNYSQHRSTDRLSKLQRTNEIGTYIFFEISAPHGKYEDVVLRP